MRKINILQKIFSTTTVKYFYIFIIIIFIIASAFLFYFLKINVYRSIYSNKKEDIGVSSTANENSSVELKRIEENIKTIEQNFERKTKIQNNEVVRDIFNN